MKYLLLNILFLLLVGCASNKPSKIAIPDIEIQPIKIPGPTLHVVETKIIEPMLGQNKYELKEAPFPPSYLSCGGVLHDDQDEIRRILENAEVVIKLTGVYEEWIPINGKPKKYYVLEIE